VAEHQALGGHPEQQLGLVLRGVGQEAPYVRQRGSVAVQGSPPRQGLRQAGQLGHQGVAEQLPAAVYGAPHRLGRVLRRGRPALAVAPDPVGVQLAQAGHGLGGPGPEQGVVAPQQEARRPRLASVVQHGLERRQVAMNVINQRNRGIGV
jgi:hypothetical protein